MRGHTLPELVADFGYDGAVGLLWEGFAGDRLTRETMRSSLGCARERAFARLADWLDKAEQRPLTEGMRLALASLPEDSTPTEILSTLPVAIAALLRRRPGYASLAPDPARATADDLARSPSTARSSDATRALRPGLNKCSSPLASVNCRYWPKPPTSTEPMRAHAEERTAKTL